MHTNTTSIEKIVASVFFTFALSFFLPSSLFALEQNRSTENLGDKYASGMVPTDTNILDVIIDFGQQVGTVDSSQTSEPISLELPGVCTLRPAARSPRSYQCFFVDKPLFELSCRNDQSDEECWEHAEELCAETCHEQILRCS